MRVLGLFCNSRVSSTGKALESFGTISGLFHVQRAWPRALPVMAHMATEGYPWIRSDSEQSSEWSWGGSAIQGFLARGRHLNPSVQVMYSKLLYGSSKRSSSYLQIYMYVFYCEFLPCPVAWLFHVQRAWLRALLVMTCMAAEGYPWIRCNSEQSSEWYKYLPLGTIFLQHETSYPYGFVFDSAKKTV